MPISFPARPAASVRLGFLFVAFVCFVVAPVWAAAPARTIVFFGDSLTAGYGLDDPSSQGYPALIQRKIDAAGLSWRTVNAGLSGETSAGGLRRIDWVLRQPIDVFVLALGGNDGLRGVDPAVTRDNLQKILDRVRAKYPRARLVIAGMQMPPAMGADFARAFEKNYPELAATTDAALIPFLLEGVGGDPRLNQPDRIHPTAAGQEIVAENVWAVLRKVL
ncbi:MAG: arylesterase [Opitutaceae bacterium]|nr:arylesterase [Opitutaceae bacterium]